MGEYEHNKIQTLISFLFTLNAKTWGTDAVVEQRIRVSSRLVEQRLQRVQTLLQRRRGIVLGFAYIVRHTCIAFDSGRPPGKRVVPRGLT